MKALLKDLRLGGGKAVAAADRLGELRESAAVKPLSELLRRPDTADDVRIQAARALGMIGDADGYKGLAAGLRSDHPEVFSACARAMAAIGAPKGGAALTTSFGHLVEVLEKKRIGKNRIHITDWERWLAAFEAAVVATGEVRPDGAVGAIRASAVKKAVCGDWDVLYSPRVGQDPKAARRKLAVATAGVLGALGGEDATEALEEMKAGCDDDPEIQKACDSALAR